MDNITLKASLRDVRYCKNGFSVCGFTAQRGNGTVFPKEIYSCGPTVIFTAIGNIQEAEPGMKFSLTGNWEKGKQANEKVFKVVESSIVLPETESEIVSFITKNCKGVGKKVAQSLVQMYGLETITICANDSTRMSEDFPKLSNKKINTISAAFKRVLIENDFRKLLNGAEIPSEYITKIVASHGLQTIEIAKNNPYLFQDSIGLLGADRIAQACGEALNSSRRVRNFILFSLGVAGNKMGSLCVDKNTLYQTLKPYLMDVSNSDIANAFNELKESYEIVVQGNWVYSKSDFIVERNLGKSISAIAKEAPSYEAEIKKAFVEWKSENSIELSEKQSEAVLNLKHKISIITGGPGTGKTTVLKAIMDVYEKVFPKEEILLMAPTGLAAKRMKESTKRFADTIHSSCGLVPAETDSGFAVGDEFDGIEAGFIGIDESSMIGTHLFDFAINAIKLRPNTRIVILGDVDQLPPVSRGNVLNDLIKCGVIKTTFLDCNFRQGKTSSITDASIKIRENRAFENNNCNLIFDNELKFISCVHQDLKKEADTIMNEILNSYLSSVALYGIKNTIILTPTHYDKGNVAGYLSQDAVNKVIQERLNPESDDKEFVKLGNRIFREGDRVIQKKNTVNVVNGDLGTILKIFTNADAERAFLIQFDSLSEEIEYTMDDVKNLELAYAITVHSSQGCEFQSCILPVSNSYSVMLTKSLYYTAITRAKKQAIIIGNQSALKRALINNKPNDRVSFLGLRILKGSKS